MTRTHTEAEQQALSVCDALCETLNDRDAEAHLAALNVPHVRLAAGRLMVWQTIDELRKAYWPAIAQSFQPNWHRSTMDRKDVVHSSADKVHVAVEYSRWTADGSLIATYQALWVVTCIDGHWGVQARSSFAP